MGRAMVATNAGRTELFSVFLGAANMRPPVTRWAYNNVFVRMAVVAIAFLTGVAVLGGVVSASAANAQAPEARLHVGPPSSIVGQGAWEAGATVTVVIDGPGDGSDRTVYVNAGSDINGDSWRIEDETLDLQPGYIVTASSGAITRTHVVKPIAFENVDIDSDTVAGSTTMVAGDWVEVALFSDFCRRRNLEVVDGLFTADFAVSGGDLPDEAATCDLVPGTFGSVEQYDEDGDLTFVMWEVPSPGQYPSIAVFPDNDVVQVEGDWEPDRDVIITVDNDQDPGNGTLFSQAFLNPGGGSAFNLDFDVARGHWVAADDGLTRREHQVTNLWVHGYDVALDTVWGSAAPGTQVTAQVTSMAGSVHSVRRVFAGDDLDDNLLDGLGPWSADFSIEGTSDIPETPQGIFDIEAGTHIVVEQQVDGDETDVEIRVPYPRFSVDPFGNSVWGEGWPEGAIVTVSLFADASPTAELLNTHDADVVRWGEQPWEIGFQIDNFDYDIVAGQLVTVDDGATVKTHQVAELWDVGLDPDTAVVSGMTAPDTVVNVNAGNESEWAWRDVVADQDGYWYVSLALPPDPADSGDGVMAAPLAENTGGSAQIFDDDQDSTSWGFCHQCGDQGGGGPFNFFSEGDLLVSDTSGRLWVYGTGNASLQEYPLPFGGNFDIQYLDSATLLIANHQGASIETLNLASGEIQSFQDDRLDQVIGIAVDHARGFFYLADESDGVWGLEIGTSDLILLAGGSADGIAVGPDGWVYYTQDGNRIEKLDPGAVTPSSELVVDLAGYRPNGITFDSEGHLVVASMGRAHSDHAAAVLRVDPSTGEYIALYEGDDMLSPEDVAVAADGTIYISDTGWVDTFGDAPGLYRLDSDGTLVPLHQGDPLRDVVDLLIAQQPPDSPEEQPNFSVRMSAQQVHGYQWTADVPVDLTIDDPSSGPDVDYSAQAMPQPAEWDPSQTFVWFAPLEDEGFVIEPGFVVELAQDGVVKSHIVQDLEVGSVDAESDTVSGVAPADARVEVHIHETEAHRSVDASSDGGWTADFASPGAEHWEQEVFDIQPGTAGEASVGDEDGDNTQVDWWLPGDPHFGVSATHDFVEGFDFGGDSVAVVFYGADGSMLFAAEAPVNHEDGGRFDLPLGFEFDVAVGQYVTVSDGIDTKSTYVAPVDFTDVDLDADTVSGVADPGADVNLQGVENLSRTVTAEDGSWFVDLSGEFDLQAPLLLVADQTDADNDRTFAIWETSALVEGHVLLDGLPLADVEVFLSPSSHTCTDASGYFAFADASMVGAAINGTFVATGPAAKEGSAGCSNVSFVDDAGIPLMVAAQGGFDLWDGYEYIELNVERAGALQSVVAADWDGVAWSPIDGLVVRAFNSGDPGFVAAFGPDPEPDAYRDILEVGLGEIGMAFTGGLLTDAPGSAEMRYAGVSDVLVLIEYPDGSVYGEMTPSDAFADRGDGVFVGPTVYFPEAPNTAPVILVFEGPIDPYSLGLEALVAGEFFDPDIDDTMTVEVDWGNGEVTTPEYDFVDGIGSFNDSHFYSAPGIYTITLTVRDASGAEAVAEYDSAVVFDPDGKSISGSPQVKIGDVSDKINFNIKYDQKTGDPEGHLKYTHKVDPSLENSKFNAEDFHFMWIFGDWAMTSGSGTFEATGEAFEFRLTVFDGTATNTDDLFRFTLWSEDTGEVFYDSQPGDPAVGFPTTVPTQGSVQVKVK